MRDFDVLPHPPRPVGIAAAASGISMVPTLISGLLLLADVLSGALGPRGVNDRQPEPKLDDEPDPELAPDEPTWEIVDDPAYGPYHLLLAPPPLPAPVSLFDPGRHPMDGEPVRIAPRAGRNRPIATQVPARGSVIETPAGPIRIEQRRS